MADAEALLEEARGFVGLAPGPFRVGRDPVNLPMVHHWCQALGDTNPAYTDASSTSRGQLIAPPGMLQTWIMDAPRDPAVLSPNDEVLRRLDEAGYTSVVAVNYEHDYRRELTHGELISVRSTCDDLSAEKSTALGPGVFTTMRYDYVTSEGELVGVGRMRLLKFKPPVKAAAPGVGIRAQPPVGRDNAFFWEGVEAGELRIQRVNGSTLRHPPLPACAGESLDWVVASGRGVVYSHVTHHHPPLPGIAAPHTVLLVELEEGVRLVSELAPGEDHEAVRVGLPVELVFAEVPGGPRPTFRPVPA